LFLSAAFDKVGNTAEALTVLAYPIGDMLVMLALVSLLLSHDRWKLPRFLIPVGVAFLVQAVADGYYVLITADQHGYSSGAWLDSAWMLSFALVGMAALIAAASKRTAAPETQAETQLELMPRPLHSFGKYSVVILPNLGVPAVGSMLVLELVRSQFSWTRDVQILTWLGVALILLLVIRQQITLMANVALSSRLFGVSSELRDRVDEMNHLTNKLEVLNRFANHLNSLGSLKEVAKESVELACWATGSFAGWVILNEEQGERTVAAMGPGFNLKKENPLLLAKTEAHVTAIPLGVRGQEIGRLSLLHSAGQSSDPEFIQAFAAIVSTAIDNVSRYEQAMILAEKDPLTGLYNHRGIHNYLSKESGRSERYGHRLSIVMIDLDDFKILNDTFGHPAGDQVLHQVADCILSVLRTSDRAGRTGGDELMLVLPETDVEGAVNLAGRLFKRITSAPFVEPNGGEIPVRLSLGVATYPDDASSLGRLIEVADNNLYSSKKRGGNVVTSCSGTDAERGSDAVLSIATQLMDAVGARDHYTRWHSEQVVSHAMALGRTLDLPEESMHTLRLAAVLHDVGRLGVPPDLLHKAGTLDSSELEAVRKHVEVGEDIVRDIPRLTGVLEAVAAHHERMDGKGYPKGLENTDIPILARIIAIADAYSAMTVERPYRQGMTPEDAQTELLRVAGTQLDADLVLKFVGQLNRADKNCATAVTVGT
jgi:diguanylate cyclase (GGDEF)-like protein